jgi:hypothetical protein
MMYSNFILEHEDLFNPDIVNALSLLENVSQNVCGALNQSLT